MQFRNKFNAEGHLLTGSHAPCHTCRESTDLGLLDGKDNGSGNFTILQCRRCYGAGWLPLATRF